MGLLDAIQAASNAAASNISGPVDGIAWLLRKAGINVPEPVGGSDWMARQGLTKQVQPGAAQVIGETAGLLGPSVIAAKAPQIAKGLLQMGENAAAKGPLTSGLSGGQRGMIPVRFVRNDAEYGMAVSVADDGTVLIEKQPWGFATNADARDKALLAAKDKFGVKYDHFWRFTNNKDELPLAVAGKLRNSRNHAQGFSEEGLSVADGVHYLSDGYKWGYPVKGQVVGYGSDGEPLLDPKTIEVLSRELQSARSIMQADKAKQAEILRANGLPADYFDGQVRFLNRIGDFSQMKP